MPCHTLLRRLYLSALVASAVFLIAPDALADWIQARCDIYPAGSDRASAVLPCVFSQRQGYVTIDRSDGVTHDLRPTGDAPGNYLDARGRPVYRQRGLGEEGLIFRFPDESVYVYWDTAGLPGAGTAGD